MLLNLYWSSQGILEPVAWEQVDTEGDFELGQF